VQPPEALGFGMTMLSRAIEYQHSGKVELDWRRQGLVCRLVQPFPESSASKRSNPAGTEAAVGTFIPMQGPPWAVRARRGFIEKGRTEKLENRLRGSAMERARA
jgi:hypothetical protein